METRSEVLQRWDDIIFENRNKAYGAYFIRKSYSDNLTRALLVSIFLALLIIILPSLMPSFVTGKVNSLPKLDDKTLWNTIAPSIIHTEPAKSTVVTRTVNENLQPQVTTANVAENHDIAPLTSNSNSLDGVATIDLSSTNGNMADAGIDLINTSVTPVTAAPIIYKYVEQMPAYVGGEKAMMKFLQKNINYPAVATRTGVEGTVYVSFVINSDGKVILPELVKGISKECDAEALRIISNMPNWIAGKQNNMPVMVRMILPVKFQLSRN